MKERKVSQSLESILDRIDGGVVRIERASLGGITGKSTKFPQKTIGVYFFKNPS